MKKSKSQRKPKERRDAALARRAQFRATLFCFATLTLMAMALPTFVVLMIGLLPTMTWFIVDMTPGRYAFRCVAGFNVASIAPYLYKLWTGPNNLEAAVDIAGDPIVWLVFLAASGCGWITFHSLPSIIVMARKLEAKRQIALLRRRQEDLKREWGPEVAGKAVPAAAARDEAGAETVA